MSFTAKVTTYRLVVLLVVAFLLVQLNIVTNGSHTRTWDTYIFALLVSLPVTMLLDKQIVRFAKRGALK